MSPTDYAARAAALRLAFDRSFGERLSPAADDHEDLLDVRAGSARFALRLGELSGLVTDAAITPVPGGVPGMLGLAGLRGAILPVYDLGRLLGQPAATAPRWLVLAAAAPVSFAFEAFDAYVRVQRADILSREAAGLEARHAREVVAIGGWARPIVSLASVLDAITRRARAGGHVEE